MRGRLWKTFLRGSCAVEPGLYNDLVSQALAPQYQNSKVSFKLPFSSAMYSLMGEPQSQKSSLAMKLCKMGPESISSRIFSEPVLHSSPSHIDTWMQKLGEPSPLLEPAHLRGELSHTGA